jgi:hypothetical protein
MDESDVVTVSDSEIWVEFSEYDDGTDYVRVPDALRIMLTHPAAESSIQLSFSCLTHLLFLLDQLKQGESGQVLSGTGLLEVTVENETIRIHSTPPLVGTPTETTTFVTSLIETVYSQLEDEGIETREIAVQSAKRNQLQAIDPVALHDAVMD